MFTVNRSDIFIAIPVDNVENCVEVEVGFDYTPYLSVTLNTRRVEIHLTATQIDDIIDSLNEIKKRMGIE